MVILRKLQDFNAKSETGLARRTKVQLNQPEKAMVAFGQEIESLVSGERAGPDKEGAASTAHPSP